MKKLRDFSGNVVIRSPLCQQKPKETELLVLSVFSVKPKFTSVPAAMNADNSRGTYLEFK